jgi:hypothetical protein
MRITALFLASALLLAVPAQAGPVEEAERFVATTLDRFNAGDIEAFVAAHQDNPVIIDEFAPYSWSGSGAVQRWMADYMRDATARGISEGRVDHGRPLQSGSDGNSAYVVLPTTYRFLQNGRRLAGRGSMTFVMVRDGTTWKIASWTYSGATPAPEQPTP